MHLWSAAAKQVNKGRVEGQDRMSHTNEVIVTVLDGVSARANVRTVNACEKMKLMLYSGQYPLLVLTNNTLTSLPSLNRTTCLLTFHLFAFQSGLNQRSSIYFVTAACP